MPFIRKQWLLLLCVVLLIHGLTAMKWSSVFQPNTRQSSSGVQQHCDIKKFEKTKKPIPLNLMLEQFSGCINDDDRALIERHRVVAFYQLDASVRKSSRSCFGRLTQCFKGDLHQSYSLQGKIANRYKAGDVLLFRFEILSRLGSGAFSDVALAFDHKHQKKVALKVAFSYARADDKLTDAGRQQKANEGLSTEYEISSRMQRYESPGKKYFNIPLLKFKWNGMLCASYSILYGLRQVQKYAEYQDFVRWIYQILLALQHLSLQGYVHNDVKPDNIMFRRNGDRFDAVLIDLGFVSKVSELTSGGTSKFMTLTRKRTYKAAANEDIYSLGLTTLSFYFGVGSIMGQESLAIVDKQRQEPIVDDILYGCITGDRYKSQINGLQCPQIPLFPTFVLEQRENLVNFILNCLFVDPSIRMSIDVALEHPLFRHLKKSEL
ncbi:hypothetical protein MP228_011843 [Amoeboaphelidium protococcarum]|nr:hypothetical protein MP228_011843 [Amoeboaphelidium protococcarum]